MKKLIVLLLFVTGSIIAQAQNFDITDQDNKMSYSVATYDQREMILDGSQNETILGYSYGLIPVAYPLFNKTGQNFSDDFSDIVVSELMKENLNCQLIHTKYNMSNNEIINHFKDTKTDRYLLFTINSWRSDSHTAAMGGLKTTISYDITREVFNKNGNILHSKTIDGTEAPFKGGKKKIRDRNWESVQNKISILLHNE